MKVITKCLDKTSNQRSASWHVVSISKQVDHTPYVLALELPQLCACLLHLSFQISHQNIEQYPQELRVSRYNFLINPEVILMVFLRDGFSFGFQLLEPSFQDRVTLDLHKAVTGFLILKYFIGDNFYHQEKDLESHVVHTYAVPAGFNMFRLQVCLPITLTSNRIRWAEFRMVFYPLLYIWEAMLELSRGSFELVHIVE